MLKKWALLMDDWSYKNGVVPGRRALFVGWTTVISFFMLSLVALVAIITGMIFLFIYNWLLALIILLVIPGMISIIFCFIMIITYKVQPDISKDIPPDIEMASVGTDWEWDNGM